MILAIVVFVATFSVGYMLGFTSGALATHNSLIRGLQAALSPEDLKELDDKLLKYVESSKNNNAK